MASTGVNFGGKGDMQTGYAPMEEALRQVWVRMEQAHESVRKKYPCLEISFIPKSVYDAMFTPKHAQNESREHSAVQMGCDSSESEFASGHAPSPRTCTSACFASVVQEASPAGSCQQDATSMVGSVLVEQPAAIKEELLTPGQDPDDPCQEPLQSHEALATSPNTEPTRLCPDLMCYNSTQYFLQVNRNKSRKWPRSFDYSASEGPSSTRELPITVDEFLDIAAGPVGNLAPVEPSIIDFPPLESVAASKAQQSTIPIETTHRNPPPASVKPRPKPLNPFDVPLKGKRRGGQSMLSRGLGALSSGPYVPPQSLGGPLQQVDMRPIFCRNRALQPKPAAKKGDKMPAEPPKKWHSDSEDEYPDPGSEEEVKPEVERKVEKTKSQLKRERKNLRKKKGNCKSKALSKGGGITDATAVAGPETDAEVAPKLESESQAEPDSEQY